jgi:hypothetical protein
VLAGLLIRRIYITGLPEPGWARLYRPGDAALVGERGPTWIPPPKASRLWEQLVVWRQGWRQPNGFDCGLYTLVSLIYLFHHKVYDRLWTKDGTLRDLQPPPLSHRGSMKRVREWMWDIISRIPDEWRVLSGTRLVEPGVGSEDDVEIMSAKNVESVTAKDVETVHALFQLHFSSR